MHSFVVDVHYFFGIDPRTHPPTDSLNGRSNSFILNVVAFFKRIRTMLTWMEAMSNIMQN